MVGTTTKIAGEEGVAALWKGVNAAWLREASYTSLRLGLYEPIKVAFGAADPASATFLKKFLAGSAAGALGSLAGSTLTVQSVMAFKITRFGYLSCLPLCVNTSSRFDLQTPLMC